MRLGIDVGGTNTDAVIMRGRDVIAAVKTATTQDIASGVVTAIEQVLKSSGASVAEIDAVMIGTTQFTNAFVERRGLNSVAAVRLSLPACQSIPPMADWPEDLVKAVGENWYLSAGGYEYHGGEIASLDEHDIAVIAKDIQQKDLPSVAISSVFAPVNNQMEVAAAEIIRHYNPDISITLSSDFGRLGLLERENAAIMNASLTLHAEKVVSSFSIALRQLDISAPFYITQNDGTLMLAETARQLPVMTFSSGPTNSMRGAAWLSGREDALVIDIGGTTSDLGFLVNGFPRESALSVDIGGVRTNFRMPDILAIGLGGGSLVSLTPETVTVGPQSVGYRLAEKALIFGGDTLTATDIAVASGLTAIGDPSRVAGFSEADIERSKLAMRTKLEEAIDRMKTRPGDIDVILVGGGSVLVDESAGLNGVGNIFKPDHFAVANAIGAAIAQIGGEVDKIYSYAELSREQALQQAQQEARRTAVAAGAKEGTLRILELEELPLAYLPNQAVRIRAKAIGEMMIEGAE